MGDIIKAIEFLGVPATVAIILVGLYLVINIIGSILDFKGKVVPEIISWRRYLRRKKEEKEKQQKLLERLETKLESFEEHYNADNIAQRDCWIDEVNNTMQWVHARADVYDQSIAQITQSLNAASESLKANTKMTEDMFVESSHDRIIDFAEKAADYDILLSREQFRRINRVYHDYENFLQERGRQNGEVDTAYETIQDGYKYRLQHHSFLEDIKGYKIKITEQND